MKCEENCPSCVCTGYEEVWRDLRLQYYGIVDTEHGCLMDDGADNEGVCPACSRGDVGADNEGPALDELVSWTGDHGRGARGRDRYNLKKRW